MCCIISVLLLSVGYATESKNSQESKEMFLANITLVNGDFKAVAPNKGATEINQSLDSIESDALKKKLAEQGENDVKQARVSANRGTRSSVFCVCQGCGG